MLEIGIYLVIYRKNKKKCKEKERGIKEKAQQKYSTKKNYI